MEQKASLGADTSPATPISTCGGCFKPVIPSHAIKRTIRPVISRYSRFSNGGKPVTPRVELFCNELCKNKADMDSCGSSKFGF